MNRTHAAYFEKTKSYAGAQAKRETLNNARRTIRKKALSFVFWLSLMGIKTSEAARRLGLKPKTVKMWKRGWKKERLKARKPGRQPVPDLGHTQLALFALFTLMDYSITYETANEILDIPRSFFYEMREEFKANLKYHSKIGLIHHLKWRRPGTVWAMDFIDLSHPIDGRHHYVLCIRDLASQWGD